MATDLIKGGATALVPVGNLNAYIAAVYGIPVLQAEEERKLAVRYRKDGDIEAARKLVLHNLRFVVQVARGYAGYGLALGDLIQEGNIGLLKAIKKFDPAIGVRLVSFAVHSVRAEIHEFIIRNWRIVKVATTKPQRKLFFKLRSAKKRLGWMNREEVEQVASDLGVKPEEVMEMESRLSGREISIDPRPGEDDESSSSPSTYLQSGTDPAEHFEQLQWSNACREKLTDAMQQLDDRSRDILRSRRLSSNKVTLQSLADKYKVSPERIRQIENQVLEKLKQTVNAPQ